MGLTFSPFPADVFVGMPDLDGEARQEARKEANAFVFAAIKGGWGGWPGDAVNGYGRQGWTGVRIEVPRLAGPAAGSSLEGAWCPTTCNVAWCPCKCS